MKLDVKLDAKTIAGLRLPDNKADEAFWDGELVGFGYRLRRRKKGIQGSWIAQTRTNDGRDAKETWSDTVSPTEARIAARKFLAGVVTGADPKRVGRRNVGRMRRRSAP